jgi:hypothetical protein
MAAAERLEWRRSFPSRALRRLAWYVVGGGAVVAATWVLFGTEPDRLDSGEVNPIALVPLAATVLVALAGAPLLLATVRRPMVMANHYGLTVRPGVMRVLLIPWAQVSELAGVVIKGEPLLLVRCGATRARLGDRPRWCDQAVLRAAGRAAAAFDLAVRMDEFAGRPAAQLASLAAWAPDQIRVTDQLR